MFIAFVNNDLVLFFTDEPERENLWTRMVTRNRKNIVISMNKIIFANVIYSNQLANHFHTTAHFFMNTQSKRWFSGISVQRLAIYKKKFVYFSNEKTVRRKSFFIQHDFL